MALSKKNLDKLKSFSNKQNFLKINNKKGQKINTPKPQKNLNESPDTELNKTFYSIIDNSENLEETSSINQKLKEIERDLFKNKYNKFDFTENCISQDLNKNSELSEEDILYDEFNYLLED
tara:strand:- start:321 stop:683 length:363 start_codon:yes stop_codon:yes gene_type:complete